MQVDDVDDFRSAAAKVRELLVCGDGNGAVAVADQCTGDERLVTQIRAYTYTEVGCDSGEIELLVRGADLWRALILDLGPSPDLCFNLANAEQGIVEAVGRKHDLVAAFMGERERGHAARVLFAKAGGDEKASDETRVTAWTNRGNSFDYFGRSFEALDCYAEAIAIDSEFGMALGNRGHTLLRYAPLIHDHQPMILRQAADAFDRALADEERIVRIGGPAALEHFRDARQRIKVGKASEPKPVQWTDPYLSWCARHELLLHVSPDCLSDEGGIVDPLYFHSVFEGVDEESQERVMILIDAFNALKQGYLSTRYLAWLATDPESPIKGPASELSKQAVFWDSLEYGRWGVTTGLAGQALADAVNVLDKVASLVHLYFETSRKPTQVYFNSLWRKRGSDEMDVELKAEIDQGNLGLLALCDLSCDNERDTALKEFVERRHAATHRFLVVHDILVDGVVPTKDWLERVSWLDLRKWLEVQLRTARAALVYLARAIDTRERRVIAEAKDEGLVPPLPMTHATTEHPEF